MKQFKFNERQRFSIRKFSIGAASVLLGSVFFAVNSVTEVQAMEANSNTVLANNADQDLGSVPTAKSEEVSPSSMTPEEDKNNSESGMLVSPILDSNPKKQALARLIEEIDGKILSGAYDEKTEDSVNRLKAVLEEAKATVNTATTEGELTQAHSRLVTATTQLKTKPEEKKQAPVVDTTNGKATVGKKASNTEKASDSNSIANSGSRDERNGKALDANNPFRTDAATTDTDPAANQTYTLPGDSANLKEVADSLINLPTKITNETKIASINEVGALQNMAPGELKDINEFGGWKASNGGVFAIARKTDKGVFPIETVNTVLVDYGPYQTWLNESTFDRSQDYALFLAEVRTKATKDEAVDDGSVYRPENHYANKGIGLAKFKGIEKTFKAYSKSTGSDVIVSFKTGFTGDIDGRKAKYRVEVFAKDESGTTSKIYDQTFKSDENKEDATKKVVAPRIGGNQYFNTNRAPLPTREALNEKLEQDSNKRRLSTSTGTFTSKGIVLAPNVTEYTVRISPGDNANLGMGYQVPWKQYALPISGLGFTIDQDTSRVAKTLLQRVYDKLKETEERDTKGKTEATINAYKAQLENVKNLLAGDLKKTQDYKDIVTAVLADQQALRTDKSKLNTSNNNLLGLINEDPDPRIGKTPVSKEPYNTAKDEAVKAQTEAQTILAQENPDPDVVAAAVSKLNEKLAELKAARAELVVAATETQKTKLAADKAKLVEASKEGKTQDSINAYEARYNALKSDLDAAVAAANDVANAQENASKVSALEAQEKVTEVLAKLEEAKALLKDKATDAQIAELKKAEKALTPISDDNLGNKKPTSVQKYKDAVAGIQSELTEAQTKVAELLEKAKTANAAKEEAAQLISKVDALKSKLTDAATLLKDKANTSALETAKNELKEAVAEEVTAGKTPETVGAYNTAKQAADEAVTAAEAVLSNPNATQDAVNAALQTVTEKKAALAAAKKALVEAATPEQKTTLATDAAALVPASKEGKTPESITAYEARLQELNGELTAAKQAAEAIAAKGENASKDAAIEAQAKVSAIKAKLADAATLLKDKANTSALETAKNELKEAVAEEVTAGKTPETVGAYNTAKQAADEAVTAAEAVLSNPNATQDAVNAALQTVTEKKAALAAAKKALLDKITQDQKDDLANAEENLKLADTTGKAKESVKAYNDEVAKLSDELAAAKQAAKDLLDKGDNAGELEAYRVQAKINKLKSKLAEAAKLLKDIDKSAAKKEVEDAAKKATDAIVANNDLTPEQKEAAKAKVAEEATKAIDAIDKATTEDDVTAASNAGKLGIEKEAAKAEIEAAKAAKEKAIDANDKLSDSEKQAAKEEAAKLADEAKKAIDAATDNAGVDGAKATGTAAVEAVNPVGKEKALDAIQKATEDKLAEIDRDDKLSDKEKDKAKAEVAKAAIDAVNAINEATNQAAVDAKQTEGTKAVSEVNPVGKDKAKAEIEKELAEKTKAIDTNTDLTPEQKADAKAKIAEEAKKAIDAINKATTTEEVASAKESGKLAIEKEAAKAEIEAAKAAKEKAIDANPDLTDEEKAEAKARVEEEAEAAKNAIDKATELSDIDKVTETGKEDIKKVTVTSAKEEAKKAIDKALEEKEKAIDARTDLTQEEKEAAKEAAREEAEAAKNAIDKATTLEDINKVLEDGKENIAKINPETLKDRAKKAIDEALAAKEKAIDARTDLTQEEKEAAKNAAREEAEAAKNAIDKATTSEDINKVLEDGKENIAKINPENLKDKAKKAIDEALAAKEKAIDARTDLTQEEKEAAKKAAREEAEAAKNAIDKATTSEDINKVLEDGKENIANINPVGAKEEAKKAVEEALANKEKEIDARTDLTPEEKVKAKELAREEARAAKDAIDKATSIEAIEKALRPFLYQIDQDALVFDRPELDIKAALQASITGTVIAERGNAITQADIIAKLNLPESITVISIDLPDTTTVGIKNAKVTLKLADGTLATVFVPVEVVEKSEENHQQNNTQVKPQEVSKPAAEPSKNSEQVEDGKDTPSKASEEKNSSKQTVLPNTGTTESVVAMIAAAASGLLGLGLAGRRRKEDEEA